MQIKITHNIDATSVCVENPATNEVVDTAVVGPGQEIVITAVNAHEKSDIEVGDVCSVSEESAEDSSEETETEGAGDGSGDE